MRHNQQQRTVYQTKRLPTFFPLLNPLQRGDIEGVEKDPASFLKTDPCLRRLRKFLRSSHSKRIRLQPIVITFMQ